MIRVLYIKLGEGGIWEKCSFDEGLVYFGFGEVSLEDCLNKNWESAREYFEGQGVKSGVVTRYLRITAQICHQM